MSEWQPIDTAPKESGNILVFVPPRFITLGWHAEGDGWMDATCPEHAGPEIDPTHWLPLPEPPKT